MATQIPLMEVVAELLDQQDRSEHYFRRLYRLGVQAARRFNMDIYGQFRTVLLDVLPNGVVNWPDDYLDYSTLGIINNSGEVVTLKHNEDLSLLKQQYLASQKQIVSIPKLPDDVIDIGIDSTLISPFFWLNFQWGDYGYIHLYGLGGGAAKIGEFTINPHNKCFYLAPGYPFNVVVLEYLSDGFDTGCNDYMVDLFAVDAIKDEIRYQSMRDLTKKFSLAEIREADRRRLITRRDAKFRINKARINEMQVTYRANIKLVAKA